MPDLLSTSKEDRKVQQNLGVQTKAVKKFPKKEEKQYSSRGVAS